MYLRADAAEASRYRIELYTCGGRAPHAPLATADLVHAFGFAREFVGVRRFCLRDEILAASDEIFVVASRAPALCAVAALGVPDERLGERLVAVVVPRAGSALAAGDLAGMLGPHVAAQLADYKVPREFRAMAETLPRNVMGKVLKAQLRQRLFGGAG